MISPVSYGRCGQFSDHPTRPSESLAHGWLIVPKTTLLGRQSCGAVVRLEAFLGSIEDDTVSKGWSMTATNMHQFAAIRGIQAQREFYTIMCPLRLVPTLFLFDEKSVPPEMRAQRTLNKTRVPMIASYLLDHADDYIFSALTASVDARVAFQPEADKGYKRNMGTLLIPKEARFFINDGQHRRAAIEQAIQENPELGDESIPVVLFVDAGLKRSQQMFSDLNKHAVRPTKSLSVLYDHRDPWAELVVKLAEAVPIFQGRTEYERTTVPKRSENLFTLHAVYLATQALLNARDDATMLHERRTLALDYWTALGDIIPEWRLTIQQQMTATELRAKYVHGHGVVLQALGEVGAELLQYDPQQWHERLRPLAEVDWRRANARLWEGRAMQHGQMTKAGHHVKLTGIAIKQALELPLSETDRELEALRDGGATHDSARTS